MKVMRMEFDIAVNGNDTADVYTLESRIAKAISGVIGVLGCQGSNKNSLCVNTVDASKLITEQNKRGNTIAEWRDGK